MGGTCRKYGKDQNLKKGILINPREKEELCIANTLTGEMSKIKLSSFLVNTNDNGKVKYT